MTDLSEIDPGFWLAMSANATGATFFIASVHAPPAADWLGHGSKILGLPAAAISVFDTATGRAHFGTWAALACAGWAAGASIVDYVFGTEYREPVRPEILVPYMVGYDVAIAALSAAQYSNGYLAWAIAGATCIVAVVTSFHARANE